MVRQLQRNSLAFPWAPPCLWAQTTYGACTHFFQSGSLSTESFLLPYSQVLWLISDHKYYFYTKGSLFQSPSLGKYSLFLIIYPKAYTSSLLASFLAYSPSEMAASSPQHILQPSFPHPALLTGTASAWSTLPSFKKTTHKLGIILFSPALSRTPNIQRGVVTPEKKAPSSLPTPDQPRGATQQYPRD